MSAPSAGEGFFVQKNPRGPAVVVDRTSGDDDQGQDAAAQLAQTVERAKAAGYVIVGAYTDEDVSGDTPWEERPQLLLALEAAERHRAVLLVREINRLWRGRPTHGLLLLERLRDLEVLDGPHWCRRDSAWTTGEGGVVEVIRFLELWKSSEEKRSAVDRTILALTEIKAGRRETRSGRPLGRPPAEIAPAHLEKAIELRSTGLSWDGIREHLRKLRGYYDVTTPAARSARDIGRSTIQRLVADALEAAQKAESLKTLLGPDGKA